MILLIWRPEMDTAYPGTNVENPICSVRQCDFRVVKHATLVTCQCERRLCLAGLLLCTGKSRLMLSLAIINQYNNIHKNTEFHTSQLSIYRQEIYTNVNLNEDIYFFFCTNLVNIPYYLHHGRDCS